MRYFDLHCDTLFEIARNGGSLAARDGHVDLTRAQNYDPYVQVFALYCGSQPLNDAETAHALFAKLMQTAQSQFAAHADRLVHCKTAQELAQAVESGRAAALLSIEGAELLQNDEDFETAVRSGVRFVNLAWNHDSVFACGALTNNKKGLTPRGIDLVHRMEQNGMIPDVSHLSHRGFWDLAECTDGPIVATHSDSAAVCRHKRNLTDEQFAELVRRRGLVGLNFYVPFVRRGREASVSDLFPHIDHLMEQGGEDILAIGADFDGCDRLPNEIRDISDIEVLAETMRAHGYSDTRIDKLFFGNAMRFAQENF